MTEWKSSPGGVKSPGPTGHLPALTWLFLAGLRPRRARLRFTKQEGIVVEDEPGEK